MAELVPYPFGALIARAFTELETAGSIFDLPQRKFVLGPGALDFSVGFHGHAAATPLGPAAGPQTQMAQNIVLSWLAGCRILELKTVQIMDELEIPRPCIDMETVGYNVEWSQELKLHESLEEYVKASMLIEMLVHSGVVEVAPGFERVIFDMSVGYDLAGIKTPEVQAFIDGMRDASEVVARLRSQIPAAYAHLRDLPFTTQLSDTLTLSTFHGCPPDEIERIIDFLLREKGLHCIVKLNPTLLGPERLRPLLAETLGYSEVVVPDSAFDKDASWEQVEGFVARLGETAAALGLSFGVKFTNTLVCENHRDFFPAEEKEMYLSGPPLHVLAMLLVQRFRERFGDRYPISFSAGIDRKNYPDAVAVGLTPVTVCSDLLKPGGYGRGQSYAKELTRRMGAVGAVDVETFILRGFGHAEAALSQAGLAPDARQACLAALAAGGDLRAAAGDGFAAWVSAAKLMNTATYAGQLASDARYSKAKNSKAPRKVGSMLELFDCLSCDKCIPVCPNDANFSLTMPPMSLPVLTARKGAAGFEVTVGDPLVLAEKHQIANFADFCNECGNCDIFCPEDGGPYVLKPRFFGSEAEWRRYPNHDGFFLSRSPDGARALARFDGHDLELAFSDSGVRYQGAGFDVRFGWEDPAGTLQGDADGDVDLTYAFIVRALDRAIFDSGTVSYVSALAHRKAS